MTIKLDSKIVAYKVITPESEAEAVRGLVIEIMKEAMATLFSEVPIEVEASIGDSWAEK